MSRSLGTSEDVFQGVLFNVLRLYASLMIENFAFQDYSHGWKVFRIINKESTEILQRCIDCITDRHMLICNRYRFQYQPGTCNRHIAPEKRV